MRNFVVTVNGAQYQVAVEEVAAGAAPVAAAPVAAPVAAPAPAPAPVAAPAPAPKAAVAGGEKVCAPMPGNIIDVKVQAGATVTRGQALVVLEAMKMENEIPAPRDGKVVQVVVTKGATVNTGDTLVVLE